MFNVTFDANFRYCNSENILKTVQETRREKRNKKKERFLKKIKKKKYINSMEKFKKRKKKEKVSKEFWGICVVKEFNYKVQFPIFFKT